MKRIASLIFVAMVLCAACAVTAQAKDDKVPTKITSDRMVYESDGSRVTFSGNVHVARPDLDIWSEKMVVYLKKTGKKGAAPSLGGDPGEIDKIVCTKNVRMLREGKEGFCGKATYLVTKDVLVMEEWPRLVDGANTIQGKIIRLYLKDNRSEVEGTPNTQVEALFFTPKQGAKPPQEAPADNGEAAPESGEAQ